MRKRGGGWYRRKREGMDKEERGHGIQCRRKRKGEGMDEEELGMV
jgi:hypothetical protein